MRQSDLYGCIPCGALAQLGERLICIQEVIGSIPIGSTNILLWIRLDQQGHLRMCLLVQPDGSFDIV